MSAPSPLHEDQRLAALRGYAVLDTPSEEAFDDLTLLAAHICEMPSAAVSLVDGDRQWFKSRLGLTMSETPRNISFCTHAILEPSKVLEVCDAEKDARFVRSPLVTGEPHIRFYAGAPLVTPDGFAVGALCVMDRVPRSLKPEQLTALAALARRVVAQLESRSHVNRLAASQLAAEALLATAEKSRRALLSVLEDEKRAGINLRESEERFRQVVENIHEVFWMSDVEKHQMLYISPGYEKIWGRTCESLYRSMQSWVESIHPEDRERVRQAVATKQLSGSYDETYRIARPDGSVRWVRDQAFPVTDADGKVGRMVGIAEDITERKALEEQFLRAQRMEAIGALSGGIAHDLNNILAPVVMGAGLLKERVTDPRDQELIRMIENAAGRGTNVIRQLLTFSRGIAGDRVSVQLRHLLNEMGDIIRETFPRDIAFDEFASRDLQLVTGDPTQLHQVIMNLCVNARDAMPAGGRLTLTAKNIELSAVDVEGHAPAKPGHYVSVTAADTGHGIPPEIVGRIFDPFFTTKEVGKGTGLGLSTVVGIVRSHGGFITVASQPNRGTAFTIYLPAATDAAGVSVVARADTLPRGNGELILVVDDEEPIRRTTRLVLEQNGYRVITAGEGAEAIAVFLENRDTVRLVVTDVMMPVMGGINLIRALRAIDPKLKVIASSGLTDQASHAEIDATGVGAILAKPCDARELLDTIHSQLVPVS